MLIPFSSDWPGFREVGGILPFLRVVPRPASLGPWSSSLTCRALVPRRRALGFRPARCSLGSMGLWFGHVLVLACPESSCPPSPLAPPYVHAPSAVVPRPWLPRLGFQPVPSASRFPEMAPACLRLGAPRRAVPEPVPRARPGVSSQLVPGRPPCARGRALPCQPRFRLGGSSWWPDVACWVGSLPRTVWSPSVFGAGSEAEWR